MTPTLRPYQEAALEAVWAAKLGGQNRLLVKMPTGTGKTVLFAAMLRVFEQRWELMVKGRSRGARMLVIAHREELLDQAADKIQAANPEAIVSVEQGARTSNRFSDVIVASIQTLAAMKFRRLKRLLEQHEFRLVIVDEAHHAAASTYRTALVHLGFLPPAEASSDDNIEAADFDDIAKMTAALEGWDARAPKDRLLVGVTATPNRSDAIGLGCVFQAMPYAFGLKQAIDEGHLVPITPWYIETHTSLEGVRTTAGDFNQKDLAHAVNNNPRNQLALAAWRDKADGLPTLAFTVDVAHAHEVARVFEADGVRAVAISGETPKEDRRQLLQAFRDRRLDVIANCMILTEGTDLPLASCILHLKPTKSATLYEQMTGRGLRPSPGKPECVVIDLVDVARRHSLMSAPVLYGLPPGLKTKGKDLAATAAAVEELLEKYPGFSVEAALAHGRLTLEDLQAQAVAVNVWEIPPLGGEVAAVVGMNWIRSGDDAYRLQYPWQRGTETLVIAKDLLGKFDISATMREPAPQATGAWVTRQRTLASGFETAVEALRTAETFIKTDRRGVERLKDRSASWRGGEASQKQLALLAKLRVPHKKGLSTGEASDLIDVAMSRFKRR